MQASLTSASAELGRKGMVDVRAGECVNSARTSFAVTTISISRLLFSPRDDVRFVTGYNK